MIQENSQATRRGLIRFVLLVVSHPEQPTAPQMSAFLLKMLPEFKAQPNGAAKVGLLWETRSMDSIDVPGLAVQTFGSEVANESRYTYRTIRHKMAGGETKCLVIYDLVSTASIPRPSTSEVTLASGGESVRKWWRFWK